MGLSGLQLHSLGCSLNGDFGEDGEVIGGEAAVEGVGEESVAMDDNGSSGEDIVDLAAGSNGFEVGGGSGGAVVRQYCGDTGVYERGGSSRAGGFHPLVCSCLFDLAG